MKKRNSYLILTLLVITLNSFAVLKQSSPQKTMIYGIVYAKKCNKDVSTYYQVQLVNTENLKEKKEELKKELEESIPDFSYIHISDSRQDYGKKASHLCAISWIETVDECRYRVYEIIFGNSEQSALDNAIKYKNKKVGTKTEYQIEDQFEFY